MPEAYRLGSKQPYEEYYITFLFKRYLGIADIVSAVVDASDISNNGDATSTVTTAGNQLNDEKTVSVWVKGGEDEHTYKITCKIVASDGSKYELDALLPILEV